MVRDVWVDFNDIDENGRVTTLTKFAARPLDVGEQVLAGDGDGNLCPAEVVSVDGPVVTLTLDLKEFKAGDPQQFAKA